MGIQVPRLAQCTAQLLPAYLVIVGLGVGPDLGPIPQDCRVLDEVDVAWSLAAVLCPRQVVELRTVRKHMMASSLDEGLFQVGGAPRVEGCAEVGDRQLESLLEEEQRSEDKADNFVDIDIRRYVTEDPQLLPLLLVLFRRFLQGLHSAQHPHLMLFLFREPYVVTASTVSLKPDDRGPVRPKAELAPITVAQVHAATQRPADAHLAFTRTGNKKPDRFPQNLLRHIRSSMRRSGNTQITPLNCPKVATQHQDPEPLDTVNNCPTFNCQISESDDTWERFTTRKDCLVRKILLGVTGSHDLLDTEEMQRDQYYRFALYQYLFHACARARRVNSASTSLSSRSDVQTTALF